MRFSKWLSLSAVLVVFAVRSGPAQAQSHITNVGTSGNYLLVQNDGNIVVNNSSGGRLWASNTGGH